MDKASKCDTNPAELRQTIRDVTGAEFSLGHVRKIMKIRSVKTQGAKGSRKPRELLSGALVAVVS